METALQIGLIKELRGIQKSVLASSDREEVKQDISIALAVASLVPPSIDDRLRNAEYKYASKERALRLLQGDMKCVESGSYHDWETIHFQVSSSLAMLMMVFCNGGISRC